MTPTGGPQAQALAATRKLPALSSQWPPPDLPSAALRRTLTGHGRWVTAVAIAPRVHHAALRAHRANMCGLTASPPGERRS